MGLIMTREEMRKYAQQSLDEVNEEIEKSNRMHALIIEKLMRRRAIFEMVIEQNS